MCRAVQFVAADSNIPTRRPHPTLSLPSSEGWPGSATLQADNAGNNATLIRIETKAGHGGGKPTSKQIDEASDIWSFIMYNLGMEFKQ